MNGLGFVSIELTSVCNKKPPGCPMCGRRKLERDHPELCNWGHIDFETLRRIRIQIPRGIVTQFHINGDPLCYPYLGQALKLFKGNIRSFNTNGNALLNRADEIIGNLETLVISIVEGDPKGEEQYDTVIRFLGIKGQESPRMVYRLLGKVSNTKRWSELTGVVANRVLHAPEGSYRYLNRPTIPEIGICLDLLTHLAIDRYGNMSMCVRFDPEGHLRLGNINKISMMEAWYGEKRQEYVRKHILGERKDLPGCMNCEYYGVATSP